MGEHCKRVQRTLTVLKVLLVDSKLFITKCCNTIDSLNIDCIKKNNSVSDLINLGFHILRIFNLVMFVLTVINIRKVKREILRFEQQKETTRTCFNFDAQR